MLFKQAAKLTDDTTAESAVSRQCSVYCFSDHRQLTCWSWL